jgi:hypothetical protein
MSIKDYDRAWKLIESVGWCQGKYRKDASGELCVNPEAACSFCMIGALKAVYGGGEVYHLKLHDVRSRLVEKTDRVLIGIAEWNDDKKRTKEEVVAVLKELDI